MGGTLDISTFYHPLRHLAPCTANIALDLRTCVRLSAFRQGAVKISSSGFEPVEFPVAQAPFSHPLGLMFAVAAYFRADGIQIEIRSASPPRSALGGSSVAAVALIAAFSALLERAGGKPLSRPDIVLLAHSLEAGVAGVPCGLQDQLAATYGGVNAWYWPRSVGEPIFRRKAIVARSDLKKLQKHLLVAYCGVPHVSKDVNSRWVRQFLAGQHRELWSEIVACTHLFVEALRTGNLGGACAAMQKETDLRRSMTPEVLDDLGLALADSAAGHNCGARFTGAGGGGCL